MPPKKSDETDKSPEVCMLRMGKGNNVIQWREEMYNLTTGLYGSTGMFFNTNASYFHLFPHERDYNPTYVPPADEPDDADHEEEAEEGEDDNTDDEAGAEDVAGQMAEVAPVISASPM